MSEETASWLNTMTLIGFTEQRGHAWHYRADEQAGEPNHYPGAIPVEDVRRRLFAWKVLEGDITSTASLLSDDGVGTLTITDPDRKAMLRPPGALGTDDAGGSSASSRPATRATTTPSGCSSRSPRSSTTTSRSARPGC